VFFLKLQKDISSWQLKRRKDCEGYGYAQAYDPFRPEVGFLPLQTVVAGTLPLAIRYRFAWSITLVKHANLLKFISI
jgi:hypothetical protein